MDSQEKNLETGVAEELNKAEDAAATTAETQAQPVETQAEAIETQAEAAEALPQTEETSAVQHKTYASKKEILDRVREIAHGDETPEKGEVDYLKTSFYKMHIAEREAQQKAYIDGGGDPEAYVITPDEDEEKFKAEMAIIREKRAKMLKEQEEEKEANLQKKLDIIERIKAMVTSPEEANKSYQEFKALQQQWKDIKSVPPAKASELWRNYQLYVEQFYDLLKLNSEAREYDFKKNLEQKTKLCEAAEKLAEEPDVISAFHQLQKLHQEYRETGPVGKEQREEIWARFKAASTVVNKRHQQHFEEIKAKEEDNLVRKTELCEKVEAIAAEENKGSGDWEKHTQQIVEVQGEWKKIGFAPQKMNVKIFERFRAACDDFFTRKAEYYKVQKETFKANAEKKRALVEQANALKESTDWKATAEKLIAMQKEWKEIGFVPKKLGDQLWADFRAACDFFFDARKANTSDQRSEERSNLEKKREIIDRLKTIAAEGGENVQEAVRKLVDEYNAIGHVPFKEKDKLFEAYRAVLDQLYSELNVTIARRKLSDFKTRIKNAAEHGESVIDSERAKLMKQYEGLRSEVQTYENNLGFLNASSKKGNSLIEEMNRKVQRLRDEMNLVKEKIKTLDQQTKGE
jgi:hypothetical protein